MDELKQLQSEWEQEEHDSYLRKEKSGDYFDGCEDVYGTCADQLKTIIGARESKEPNLNIDIGEELPDLLKPQAE